MKDTGSTPSETLNDPKHPWRRCLKNPYHRMGAAAVFFIFAAMHMAYDVVAQGAPEGTRGRLLLLAGVFGGTAAAVSAVLGARFQKKIDRLSGPVSASGHPAQASDEFFQIDQRVSGMARDLESRVLDLEREKTKLDAMLRSMSEGLLVIAQNRSILLINPAAAVMLGLSETRSIGKSLLETVRNAELEALVGLALAGGKTISKEIRFFGSPDRHLMVSAAPYQIASGERQAALVFHDVTELHRLENLRREFVANVSHELKTPLTSLQGFIETLLAGAWQKPEHAKRFLQMMDEDAKRLSRLIHDLLDLSSIEQGGGLSKREPMDPAAPAARALTALQTAIVAKEIRVDNSVSAGMCTVMGDSDQLEQVWVNLLENAVKFTPQGGNIGIHSFKESDRIRFEVTDTGAGIPQEALGRIFERFYRVDPARSRELGGTGLGLSIVKHIIEQHGGTVSAISPGPGLGSVFSFTLPLPS
ncbi:MAG: PAS domain-containing protein [Candidatus Omnitrophica bacterium]|jgi:two-component system phosphate regulon sensor histidine kinase PhoR|nr:PAS domain-containing protein [Candidatus Omnitrophota bacterium]